MQELPRAAKSINNDILRLTSNVTIFGNDTPRKINS